MDPEAREELAATVAARRELGDAHEQELIDGFLDRLDRRLEQRSSGQVAETHTTAHMRFVIALASLGTGVPISAIAASLAGLPGLLVAWVGIVGVNLATRR